MLSWVQIAQLCSFSFFMAAGQYFFKMAAMHAPALTSVTAVLGLALNPWLWAAIMIYGLSTLIWISVLQSVPLSTAYPFAALGFIIVPLIARVFFKEPLTWQYGVAVLLIMAALRLVTMSGPAKV